MTLSEMISRFRYHESLFLYIYVIANFEKVASCQSEVGVQRVQLGRRGVSLRFLFTIPYRFYLFHGTACCLNIEQYIWIIKRQLFL